jgi:hypothetical protein
MMYGGEAPRLLADLLPTSPEGEAEPLTQEQKEIRAVAGLKKRAEERLKRKKCGQRKWQPAVGKAVLVETHHGSDANQGVTHKFMRPYEGPFWITRIVSPSIF